jgi:hypothetical protein
MWRQFLASNNINTANTTNVQLTVFWWEWGRRIESKGKGVEIGNNA